MQLERTGAVALLRMNAGKANAINPAFLDRMNALLDELEAAPPRALLLTGHGRAFCAGLDLPTLIDLDRAQLTAFIRRFSEFMLRVFMLPWPVVAAVNGHAVAGGCVLALQADQRLMAGGEGVIGLNEVRLGIGLPSVVVETLRCQFPPSSLFPIACEGGLFPPAEAHRLGLVQEVVEPERLLQRAADRAAALAEIPAPAFASVKRSLRKPVLDTIRAAEVEDAAAWVGTFHGPEGQVLLREVVARLTKRVS
jgi:enoyl-CoA hydratase